MGERRMFSKTIVQAGKFLRMAPSTRLLYYDLGMAADDDGIVEAYSVMIQTKAAEDDLRVLVAKGYVQILNEDLVSRIMDWSINNTIRADRYHPSIYKDLLLQIGDNQMATICQPSDNQMETEVKLSKDKLSKDNKNYYPDDEVLNQAFCEYAEMRKKIKKPLTTDRAVELAKKKLQDLSGGDVEKAVQILNQSILSSWQGLYPLKEDKKTDKPNKFTCHNQQVYDFDELEKLI